MKKTLVTVKYKNRTKTVAVGISTAAALIATFSGCASVNQSELLQLINDGQMIEIVVATPTENEQGTVNEVIWVSLDQLDNYPEFRSAFEDILGITAFGNNSKNGIAYVDLEGNQKGNNTLYNAFMNRKFVANYWGNETATDKTADAVLSLYTDIDAESKNIQYAAINAYWNLMPDASPNYFNGESLMTRGEAMALVMRAETEVTEDGKPVADESFASAVGQSEFTDYASYEAKYSYLDTESKSLNNMTFNETMTRGEFAYMLVNKYFANELKGIDPKSVTMNDCKDGGNIASKQKFVEDTTSKDYWKSYELVYALQNPDAGAPTELYNAIATAVNLGIMSADTRWDEGLTKADSIEMLIKSYEAYAKANGYASDALVGLGTESTAAVEDTAVDVKDRDESTFISLEDESFKFEFEQFLLENGVTDWTKWKPFVDSLSDEDRQKIDDKYFMAIIVDDQIDYIKDYWCFIMNGEELWEGGYDDNGMRIATITESTWAEYKKNHGITDWASFKKHVESLDYDELWKVSDNLFGDDDMTDKESDYIIHILNPEYEFNESDYHSNGDYIKLGEKVEQSQPSQPSTPSQPSEPACNCIQYSCDDCIACQHCICY